MVDLFRYIEQSFIVPPLKLDAIDVNDSSDFQDKLRTELQSNPDDPDKIRKTAEDFIKNNPFQNPGSLQLGQEYLDLHTRLLHLADANTDNIKGSIEKIFDRSPLDLIASDAFKKDRQLLNDLIIAVKMTTAFDKVRAADVVSMRQAIAFIEAIIEKNYQRLSVEAIKSILLRPIVIPEAFLKKQTPEVAPIPVPAGDSEEVIKRKALEKEQESMKAAYFTLKALKPHELQMTDVPGTKTSLIAIPQTRKVRSGVLGWIAAAFWPRSETTTPIMREEQQSPKQVLSLTNAAFNKLDPSVLKTFEREQPDFRTAGYTELTQLAKSLVDAPFYKDPILASLIAKCHRVKAVTKVYRVGINTFAVQPAQDTTIAPSSGSPDFTNAITRPVGIGKLQVVRQELLSYEAKEISHIENILEGEILRHSTTRRDTNEVTITDETQTTQFDERDLQSTIRNEMASETQKEAGQQASSTQDQTSTTSYGKLVENSKSNYAKTVTDRAVSSLTQQVKHQRVQRVKNSFTEKSVHEFDNSKAGAKNVTGIYQWVDKKYRTQIVNYGTRLLYDVVVPEPAAFLIESLQTAPQPEGLDLVKPEIFDKCPDCLNVFNYACLAAQYGASGAVQPPPDDFIKTVPYTDPLMAAPSKLKISSEETVDGFLFKDFQIEIPEGYTAISCYVQMVHPNIFYNDDTWIEFRIGQFIKSTLHFNKGDEHFVMNNETGHIPVIFRTGNSIYQYSFAIGIYCQLGQRAYAEWQLKTHAAIMAGYNRQLAEYHDKLSKFQAIIRSQMAQAANFAHNPAIEKAELKKAFIYLLLGEHFGAAYIPTPDPLLVPPNPVYIKKWGAMVAFFERAFEWENIMYTYYPYFWGRRARWGELILIQDINPQFEEFLKAGAARVVVPVRPGFEGALSHYQETGKLWMGEEMPDIFSPFYVSMIQEVKARNFAPADEVVVEEWEVSLPTTLVMLKKDALLPDFKKQ